MAALFFVYNKIMKNTLKRGIDHIGASAVALVHDGEGNLLLQKRGPKARDEQGRWDFCGGAIEFGETIEETITRELLEELGIAPLDLQFLTAYDAHREQNGQQTHWIVVVYAVKVSPKEVRIAEPEKVSEIGWFTSHNLPSPTHSQFNKSFEPALAHGIIK